MNFRITFVSALLMIVVSLVTASSIANAQIIEHVRVYAQEGNWSVRNADADIAANGVERYNRYSEGKIAKPAIYLSLGTFKKIALAGVDCKPIPIEAIKGANE